MAPLLKRRKIIDGSSTAITLTKGITTFAKITKSSVFTYEKDISDSDTERKHKSAHNAIVQTKKRSRDAESEEGSCERQRKVARVVDSNQNVKSTPRKKVCSSTRPVIGSNEEEDENRTKQLLLTPTKGSRLLLESFKISSPVKSKDILDEESQNLIALHTALLNSLAIHYAHNGTASPIDIKILIPKVEKKWNRRRLRLEDIQRVLGILHSQSKSALSLAERTKGRVCIEYDQSAADVLPVETLKHVFTQAIRRLQASASEFPLEPVTTYIRTTNIMLSKGAQRLADLKLGSTTKAAPIVPKPESSGSTSTRATNLLDRILAKEAHLSTLPSAPSPSAIARLAALQRLPEIIPILEVLSSSSSNSIQSGRNLYGSAPTGLGGLRPSPALKVASLTMPAVLQRLQGSLRHPVSREDCERAVRLVAEEVCPRWIQIREVGSVIGVVFRGMVSRDQWIKKVNALIAASN